MKLLIVRHGDAGDSEEFAKTGEPDNLRPLSPKGHEQMRDASEGLRVLVPSADLIVTSPYTRAVQTAEIVRSAYGKVPQEVTEMLEPDASPAGFETWMRTHGDKAVVIAVGHEPNLGMLGTWLMTGSDESRIEMKKGGACLLAFDGRVKKGEGMLRWLMGPKDLAAIAER